VCVDGVDQKWKKGCCVVHRLLFVSQCESVTTLRAPGGMIAFFFRKMIRRRKAARAENKQKRTEGQTKQLNLGEYIVEQKEKVI